MASDAGSPPGSPLSSIASDEFTPNDDDDLAPHSRSRDDTVSVDSPSVSTPVTSSMHPSKRRRTGAYERAAGTPLSVTTGLDGDETMNYARATSPADSISSDSSGDVPNSPYGHLAPGMRDEDDGGLGSGDQVTACRWTGCTAGDLGNMDALVSHLHNVHIPHRQKKYSCEWADCPRKSMPHASGYALRAHMRSHTREKPFYCALPECDRSFTRSDALAKHMRTVHETEALRPSDPVPKGHSGGPLGAGLGGNGNLKRIKLIFGGKEKGARAGLGSGELPPLPPLLPVNGVNGDVDLPATEMDIDSTPFEQPVPGDYYPLEISTALSEYELSLPPSQLFRLLRRQVKWAERESHALDIQVNDLVDRTDDLVGSNGAIEKKPGTEISSASVDEKSENTRRAAWKCTEVVLGDIAASTGLPASHWNGTTSKSQGVGYGEA